MATNGLTTTTFTKFDIDLFKKKKEGNHFV